MGLSVILLDITKNFTLKFFINKSTFFYQIASVSKQEMKPVCLP